MRHRRADRIAERAETEGWTVDLRYFDGEIVQVYDDESTRVVTEERCVLLIDRDGLGYALGWTRNSETGRWNLLEEPTLIRGDGEWIASVSEVERVLGLR